jgi:hypothetical protein
MRNITRTIGVGIAATALFGATAISASAADSAVTFELAGGSLTVDPAASAVLTAGVSGATSVSGALGDVVVTDNRGGVADWSIDAASTVFTNGTTTSTAVEYVTGTVTTTGVVTAAGGTKALDTVAVEVVGGTLVEGNNTATWNPTLTVTLPSSSTAGTYSGTITTSVL